MLCLSACAIASSASISAPVKEKRSSRWRPLMELASSCRANGYDELLQRTPTANAAARAAVRRAHVVAVALRAVAISDMQTGRGGGGAPELLPGAYVVSERMGR